MTTEPTPEEIAECIRAAKVRCVHPDAATTIEIARAVLQRWGHPSGAGEVVAWRYRMRGDLQWQYTERPEQFTHADEVQELTTPQPNRAVPHARLTDEQIEAAWQELQTRRAAQVAKDFNARIGQKCSQCGAGAYRADGNGYHSFHRCDACNHVPFFHADGKEWTAPNGIGIKGKEAGMPDLSTLTERGARAWAGVDAQKLREDGTT